MRVDALVWLCAALDSHAHPLAGPPCGAALAVLPRDGTCRDGKLYDDAKKGQNDETLEAALFAAANTE